MRVLEVACANGYLTRPMARRGAHVTAVDGSEGMISCARERERQAPSGVEYLVGDVADLSGLADGSFGAVAANMALMGISDAGGALLEAARVLEDGGRLVASMIHPCFDTGQENSCRVAERYAYAETRIFRKVGRYRETVERRFAWRVVGREDPDTVLETAYYHRPLSWYFRALRAAGLEVTAFEEPGHQGWSEASSDRGLASMSDERTPVSEGLARVSEEIT